MTDGGTTADWRALRRLAGVALAAAACLVGAAVTAAEDMPMPELRPDPPASATGQLAAGSMPPLRILFEAGDDTVSAAYGDLLDRLARRLETLDGTSVRIRAYAPAEGDDRAARRLSLSRALAVRERLIAGGLGRSRINILALGGLEVTGPQNRVDVGLTR